MKILLCMICVVLVSGCATQVQVQETDHYSSIEPMKAVNVTVEQYPSPEAVTLRQGNESYAAFSKPEFDKLRQMRENANKNAEVLQAVIEVNEALVAERNLMLEAARAEERRANNLERDYARTEEKLRNEEQMRIIEGTIHKIIIIGLIAAGI